MAIDAGTTELISQQSARRWVLLLSFTAAVAVALLLFGCSNPTGSSSAGTADAALETDAGGGAAETAAAPAPVQQTGQTESRADGDDGDLRPGVPWPNPRFTDNNDGTITDNLTGLIWLKDLSAIGQQTWAAAFTQTAALADGQHGLTDGSSAGDWRLPNVRELFSLVDLGVTDPSLPDGHPFTRFPDSNKNFWTSTSVAGDSSSRAWFVSMFNGSVSIDRQTFIFWVLPVRGVSSSSFPAPVPVAGGAAGPGPDGQGVPQEGVGWPTPRFTDNGNGTVTDTLTGLMWHKNLNPAGETMTWTEALAYTRDLTHAGHNDWRLPTIRELLSLADYSTVDPALPAGHPFTGLETVAGNSLEFYFWSSTTSARFGTNRWSAALGGGAVVGGGGGKMESRNPISPLFVWPVRG